MDGSSFIGPSGDQLPVEKIFRTGRKEYNMKCLFKDLKDALYLLATPGNKGNLGNRRLFFHPRVDTPGIFSAVKEIFPAYDLRIVPRDWLALREDPLSPF